MYKVVSNVDLRNTIVKWFLLFAFSVEKTEHQKGLVTHLRTLGWYFLRLITWSCLLPLRETHRYFKYIFSLNIKTLEVINNTTLGKIAHNHFQLCLLAIWLSMKIVLCSSIGCQRRWETKDCELISNIIMKSSMILHE